MEEFEVIQKYLMRSARESDKAIFTLLQNDEISLEEARDRFMNNNEFPEYAFITTQEFKRWLQSLGWLHGLSHIHY